MPHSKRVNSDGSNDEDRQVHRDGVPPFNGPEEPGPAHTRRDENALSFRHFLQPQSDVVTSRSRPGRGASAGSVDLVDGAAMALPDFVQDHLGSDGGAGSSDPVGPNVSVPETHHAGASALPEYANLSSASHEYSSQRSHSLIGLRNGRVEGSSSSNGDASVSHSNHNQVALPDFLSDGPMLCSNNALENSNSLPPSASSQLRNGSNPVLSTGPHLGTRNERDALLRQIEQLSRELEEKSRNVNRLEQEFRLKEMENTVLAAECNQLRTHLQAMTKRAIAAERVVTELQPSQTKNHSSDGSSRKREDLRNAGAQGTSGAHSNGFAQSLNPQQALEISFSAEFLIGELMQQIDSLKRLAMANAGTQDAVAEAPRSSRKDKTKSTSSYKPS